MNSERHLKDLTENSQKGGQRDGHYLMRGWRDGWTRPFGGPAKGAGSAQRAGAVGRTVMDLTRPQQQVRKGQAPVGWPL